MMKSLFLCWTLAFSITAFAQVTDVQSSTSEREAEGGGTVQTRRVSGTVRMSRDQIREMNNHCRGKTSIHRDVCQMEYRLNLVRQAAAEQEGTSERQPSPPAPSESNADPMRELNQDLASAPVPDTPARERSISCSFGEEKCRDFQLRINQCPGNYSDSKCEAMATYDVMTPDSVKKLCPHSDKLACSLYAKKFMGCYVKNKTGVKNVIAECNGLAQNYSNEFEKISGNFTSGHGELVAKMDGCLGDDKLDVFDDGKINRVCSRASSDQERERCGEFFRNKTSSEIGKCVESSNSYMAENFSANIAMEACSDMADGSSMVSCNGFQYRLTDNVLNTSRRMGKMVEDGASSSDPGPSDGSGATSR